MGGPRWHKKHLQRHHLIILIKMVSEIVNKMIMILYVYKKLCRYLRQCGRRRLCVTTSSMRNVTTHSLQTMFLPRRENVTQAIIRNVESHTSQVLAKRQCQCVETVLRNIVMKLRWVRERLCAELSIRHSVTPGTMK